MALEARWAPVSYPCKRYFPGAVSVPDTVVERKTIAATRRHSPVPRQLYPGPFEVEVDSFRLHLAGEGKAGRTLDTYTEAVRLFAAAHLLRETGKTSWEQVDRQDLQRWTVWLMGKYSTAYASNQFRAVRRFLRWLAAEQDRPDPTARLRAPAARPRLVPVFTSEELSALRGACQGRSFGARRGRRDHRCAPGDRHPPVRTRRDPLRPGRSCPRRPGPGGPGDPGPRQGRPGTDRQDQLPGGAQRGPLPAGPRETSAGVPAGAVAGDRRAGAGNPGRDLPDRRQRGQQGRGGRVPAPVPASLQPHLANGQNCV